MREDKTGKRRKSLEVLTGKGVLRVHPAQHSPSGGPVRRGSRFHARLAGQRAAVPKLGSADRRAHGAALSMNEDEPQSGSGILRLAGEKGGGGGGGSAERRVPDRSAPPSGTLRSVRPIRCSSARRAQAAALDSFCPRAQLRLPRVYRSRI